MNNNQIQTDLQSIRMVMERSSKFISLSGLSGVLAGCFAGIGGVYLYIKVGEVPSADNLNSSDVSIVLQIASIVLLLSIGTAIGLAYKKGKRLKQNIWNQASRGLLKAMILPLLSGGIVSLILLSQNIYQPILGLCMTFYGLSLYAAGNYTFNDIKTLGVLQVLTGLLTILFPEISWYTWMFGFGLLHILYGIGMHLKYEGKKQERHV